MLVEELQASDGPVRAVATRLTALSVRRWVIASTVAITAATLVMLQILGRRIEQLVGHPPFDLQTPLAIDAVLAQAPSYSSEARVVYAAFLLVDFVFPVAASLLLVFVAARSIRAFQRLTGRAQRVSLLVLIPLAGALFDWIENVFFALAVWNPQSVELWAVIAVTVKSTKVAVSVVGISAAVLTFAIAVGLWSVVARLRRTRRDA